MGIIYYYIILYMGIIYYYITKKYNEHKDYCNLLFTFKLLAKMKFPKLLDVAIIY